MTNWRNGSAREANDSLRTSHCWTKDYPELFDHARRAALSIVNDPGVAEDVAQQAWIELLRGSGRPRNPRGWLSAVARQRARDFVRRDRARRCSEAFAPTRHTAPSTLSTLVEQQMLQAVADAARALPEPYATVVQLRYFEELPLYEVAERTGAPVETVRTRLSRAHEMLSARLGSDPRDRYSALAVLPLLSRSSKAQHASVSLLPWLAISACLLAVLGIAFLATRTFESARPVAASNQPESRSLIAESTTRGATSTRRSKLALPIEDSTQEVSRKRQVVGRVLDSRGRPRAGIRVGAWPGWPAMEQDYDSVAPLKQDETDSEGRFQLLGLSGPKFHIWARGAGLVAQTATLYNEDSIPRALEIVLTHEGEIRGVVLDDLGHPLAGAQVHSFRRRGFARTRFCEESRTYEFDLVSRQSVTNARGEFRLSGLAPGDYPLFCDAPGRPPHVRLTAAGETSVVLSVPPDCEVRVHVLDTTGDSLAGRRVELEAVRSRIARTATTDANGLAVFDGVPTSEALFLRVQHDDSAPLAFGPLHATARGLRLDARVPTTRAHGGRVVTVDGNGVAGARVTVTLAPQPGEFVFAADPKIDAAQAKYSTVWTTETDADGAFHFPNLPALRSSVAVSSPTTAWAPVLYHLARERSEPQRVTVGQTGQVFVGQIVDAETGDPLRSSATVEFVRLEAADRHLTGRVHDDGTYRLAVADRESTHAVLAAPGYAPQIVRLGRGRIELEPTQTVELRFVEIDGSPVSSGTVLLHDASGEPVFAESSPGLFTSALRIPEEGVCTALLSTSDLRMTVYPSHLRPAESFTLSDTELESGAAELVLTSHAPVAPIANWIDLEGPPSDQPGPLRGRVLDAQGQVLRQWEWMVNPSGIPQLEPDRGIEFVSRSKNGWNRFRTPLHANGWFTRARTGQQDLRQPDLRDELSIAWPAAGVRLEVTTPSGATIQREVAPDVGVWTVPRLRLRLEPERASLAVLAGEGVLREGDSRR